MIIDIFIILAAALVGVVSAYIINVLRTEQMNSVEKYKNSEEIKQENLHDSFDKEFIENSHQYIVNNFNTMHDDFDLKSYISRHQKFMHLLALLIESANAFGGAVIYEKNSDNKAAHQSFEEAKQENLHDGFDEKVMDNCYQVTVNNYATLQSFEETEQKHTHYLLDKIHDAKFRHEFIQCVIYESNDFKNKNQPFEQLKNKLMYVHFNICDEIFKLIRHILRCDSHIVINHTQIISKVISNLFMLIEILSYVNIPLNELQNIKNEIITDLEVLKNKCNDKKITESDFLLVNNIWRKIEFYINIKTKYKEYIEHSSNCDLSETKTNNTMNKSSVN